MLAVFHRIYKSTHPQTPSEEGTYVVQSWLCTDCLLFG